MVPYTVKGGFMSSLECGCQVNMVLNVHRNHKAYEGRGCVGAK